MSFRRAILSGALASLAGGCAVQYLDEDGAYHVYGLAHVVLKNAAPPEDSKALLVKVQTLGFSVQQAPTGSGLVLGWDSRSWIELLDPDVAVSFSSLDEDGLDAAIVIDRTRR